MYNLLENYIKNAELRDLNSGIKVKLSKELTKKFDQGLYKNYLIKMEKCYELIKKVNIKYPDNSNPILYIYIVPDDNYAEMLGIPSIFNNGTGGGKPVKSFDKDSFYYAYGVSQNRCENHPEKTNIMNFANNVHELAHLVHGEFFRKNNMLGEGFAETLSLYILDLEESFNEYKEALQNIKENQIYTAQELINQEKNHIFGKEALLSNKSCSFRLSYISSYLFVRGIIEIIETKYNYTKQEAAQFFLDMMKKQENSNEQLITDIANQLNIEQEELLNGKQMQLETLKEMTKEVKRCSK